MEYRIYSNKRCGAHLIFRASNVARIPGRRLFEGGAYFKIGSDKEIFSFNLTVYFLSVLKFYSNKQKSLLIVTIRLFRHFNVTKIVRKKQNKVRGLLG